jgi:hypothetical protein
MTMRPVKSLCLILLLALSMSSCSMFGKGDGQSRSYRKYLKKMKVTRERQRKTIQQRAEMPTLRDSPLSPAEETVQVSESQ